MREQQLAIEHNGKTYYGQIARIDSTNFGSEDHGILTAMLHCSWKGGGIGVGQYCLDAPIKDASGKHSHREGTGYGLDHLMAIMCTVGVDRWEQLPGKQVIILFEGKSPLGSIAKGIASLLDDDVLIFSEHADKWQEDHA